MNKIFAVAIIAIVLVSAMGLVSAHFASSATAANAVAADSETGSIDEMQQCPMHSGNEMEKMMEGTADCMGMSVEEMDKDNDGVCDYCGMKAEDCEEMQSMHSTGSGMAGMHEMMHGNANNSENEMPCGMH